MRGYERNELAGRNDLRLLVVYWKMLHVASDQVIRRAGIGALVEAVVGLIAGDRQDSVRVHYQARLPYHSHYLIDSSAAQLESWTPENFFIFSQDSRGDDHENLLGGRQVKNGSG